MNHFAFYTAFGQVRIINLNQFIEGIKTIAHSSDMVNVDHIGYHQIESISGSTYHPNNSDILFDDAHFTKKQAKLQLIKQEFRIAAFKNMFISLLLNKKPIFLKDVTLDILNSKVIDIISQEFAFDGDLKLIPISLSKTQNYIVLAPYSAFEIHETYDRMRGALAEIKPKAWVAVRFENYKLLEEFNNAKCYIHSSY